MKKLYILLGVIFNALSPDLIAGDCPSLSGKFTIGKDQNADFSSVTEAVHSLQCGGISGPVNFVLENGIYNEKVIISSIHGASEFNTVTFQSKSGDNTEVVIGYGNSDATLVLNGSSFIHFENLTIDHKAATYGNCVRVDGKAASLHFNGVVMNGIDAAKTGPENAAVYLVPTASKTDIAIRDCEINNGSIGICKGGQSADLADSRTEIIGTLFMDQYESAIALSHEDAPVIANNVVSSLSGFGDYKAIRLENILHNVKMSQNIIKATNGSTGLWMNSCTAEASNPGQINSNSINVGGNSQAYGIWLTGNSDNQILNFNRVKLAIQGNQTASQGYFKNSSSGNNINLLNNIFYDLNSGGYTIVGNTYKDLFNQLPSQSNPILTASANGIMIEKVSVIK